VNQDLPESPDLLDLQDHRVQQDSQAERVQEERLVKRVTKDGRVCLVFKVLEDKTAIQVHLVIRDHRALRV
jgi:hypothetical protein